MTSMSVLWRFVSRTLLATALLTSCAVPPLPRGSALLTDSEGHGSMILVEIAATPEERSLGLMGRDFLPTGSGMAFLFDEPSDGGFWMKDTLIPLEIAYWDEGGTIVDIQQMVPCEEEPCERYPAAAPFIGALEVNPGTFADAGIEVGDTIEIVPGEAASRDA